MQLKWAAGGGGLLAETSSDSDSSNRSYYGETKLHFLSVGCFLLCVFAAIMSAGPTKEDCYVDVRMLGAALAAEGLATASLDFLCSKIAVGSQTGSCSKMLVASRAH